MQMSGEWAIAAIVKAILNWVAEFVSGLYKRYVQKKEDESSNAEIREKVEHAETDEERQDALDRAGDRFGNP